MDGSSTAGPYVSYINNNNMNNSYSYNATTTTTSPLKNHGTVLVNSRLFMTPPSPRRGNDGQRNTNRRFEYNDFLSASHNEEEDALRQAEQWERKFKSLFK
ncbi:hypothetical protein STCU_11402 [Strigomonas culicis]|uniref:Uncharacterized protein n=1 Tax=Strigomonas culicis TaxID=28005 RepID=S9TE44_9TRYP|nr:hypothetical protein STCU_11402 [Strigomonas culicis]|eukprot:EPY16322.1 hypothetical protein STCU_11402 [Strigomonas culicis]